MALRLSAAQAVIRMPRTGHVGGRNGSIVIDVSKLKAVTLDASGTAKIQTGNRLGEVAQKLWDNGQRALPHGACPYGHAAFGGFGTLSRITGLLHDYVTEAEVVLANGTLTIASAKKNSELFWALRGDCVISYKLDYALGTLTPTVAQDHMEKWQAIAFSAPDNLSVICTIGGFGGNLYLQYRGTYYGTKTDFDALSSSWDNALKPDNFTSEAHNWYDGLVALSGPLSTEQSQASSNFFAKSIFFKSAVTSTQWKNFFDYIVKEGLNANYLWYIEVDRYGGGVAKQPPDATSFAHRDAAISFQLATVGTDPLPTGSISFLNNMLTAVEPNPKAAYVNYVDPTLTPAQWKQQYYDTHYPRLVSIKRKYYPKNVFRFPQSIGLSG